MPFITKNISGRFWMSGTELHQTLPLLWGLCGLRGQGTEGKAASLGVLTPIKGAQHLLSFFIIPS